MMAYNPFDWYWTVGGDEERAYSSKSLSYVTEWPQDCVTRIDTEANLRDVLIQAGVIKTKIYKADIWVRSTDDEAATIDAAINAQTVRFRRLWDDARYLDTEDQFYPMVKAAFVSSFGETRTNELLMPTE